MVHFAVLNLSLRSNPQIIKSFIPNHISETPKANILDLRFLIRYTSFYFDQALLYKLDSDISLGNIFRFPMSTTYNASPVSPAKVGREFCEIRRLERGIHGSHLRS